MTTLLNRLGAIGLTGFVVVTFLVMAQAAACLAAIAQSV
jgi:hypothetical protein